MKNKLLSFFLCATLALSLFPASVLAEETAVSTEEEYLIVSEEAETLPSSETLTDNSFSPAEDAVSEQTDAVDTAEEPDDDPEEHNPVLYPNRPYTRQNLLRQSPGLPHC